MHRPPKAHAPPCEIPAALAQQLLALQIGILIDVRQPVEHALEGEVTGAASMPLFRLKHSLGHVLSTEEQEILDSGKPDAQDIQTFLEMVSRHHDHEGTVLLCLCRSGKRSLHAASLLRAIGYSRAFSVAGGLRAWRECQ